MNREQLESMEPIVLSFLNKAYECGEWLVQEGVVNKEDLKDGEDAVLLGIPSLTILHCIERSSSFEDEFIHLSIDKTVDAEDPRYTGDVKEILQKIRNGKKLYRKIAFTNASYDIFRRKMVLRHKFSVCFRETEKDLFKLIVELTLLITRIDVFKKSFLNVVDVLKLSIPEEDS